VQQLVTRMNVPSSDQTLPRCTATYIFIIIYKYFIIIIIIIAENSISETERRNVPVTQMALPRWIAAERRWRTYYYYYYYTKWNELSDTKLYSISEALDKKIRLLSRSTCSMCTKLYAHFTADANKMSFIHDLYFANILGLQRNFWLKYKLAITII